MKALKFRRYIFLIVALLLCAMMAVALVACDEEPDVNPDDNLGEYETSTYQITFDSNGGTDFSNCNYIAEYGSRISQPSSTPVKSGYTFAFWSKDGATKFDFATETVGGNITLKAIYNATVYEHQYDLHAVLSKDGDNFVLTDGAYTSSYITTGTKLTSTYNSATSKLAIPSTSKTGDKFCFWYYMDANNKPVQFSKWATADAQNVEIVAKYTFTKGLKLYPMWYSTLPKVSVTFLDGKSTDTYKNMDVTYGDYLAKGEAPVYNTDFSKNGYEFKEWYYVIEKDGNESKIPFVFDDLSDENDKPTDLSTASGATSVFDGAELKLYAQWTKLVSLASVQDFKDIKEKLSVEEPNEEQLEVINEILNGKIQVASINFASEILSPLFDKTQVFKGVIDGATYDNQGNITLKAVLSGGVFKGVEHVSIFGCVAGEVKNVDVSNVTIQIDKNDDNVYASKVNAGLLVSVNSGTISNCAVTQTSLVIKGEGALDNGLLINGLSKIVFGGIASQNSGDIKECVVNISGIDVLAKSFTFGGIVGENSATLLKNTANVSASSIVLAKDSNPTSDSTLKMGGIVGMGGGTVEKCVATLSATALSADSGVNIGGIVGDLTGVVRISQATLTLGSNGAPVAVGSSTNAVAIGGLVGKNGGQIANCLADNAVFVGAKNANVAIRVGGLVGDNFNASSSSSVGSIKTSYATGALNAIVDDAIEGVELHVGGLVGRNSQTNISSNFTVATINVTNQNGTNKLGYMFGSMEKTASIKTGFYILDLSVTLNGVRYVDSEDTFPLEKMGSAVNGDKLKQNEWVFGKSTLNFSNDVWEIKVEGESLPTLKI